MSELKSRLKANLRPEPAVRTADILRSGTSTPKANEQTAPEPVPSPPPSDDAPKPRTTLELPVALHIRARHAAIDAGTSLNAVVVEALRAYLAGLDAGEVELPSELGDIERRAVTVRMPAELHRQLRRSAFMRAVSMSAITATALSRV